MEVIALQSGSNGNCIYVESDGVRLLFDAGISGKQAQQRLADAGKDIGNVQALLISHDHRDHSRCLGVYQRKFGLPIYVTRGTLSVTQRKENVGTLSDVHYFTTGAVLRFGHLTVETIATPHDAVDGVAFIVDDGRRRLGIWTDLGHVYGDLLRLMPTLDALLLESNHDPDMLDNGPYPELLKRRISGKRGHLSNQEAAGLLRHARRDLVWACLGHLSEENNQPEVALETHRRSLGDDFPLRVASRYAATGVFEL